MKIHDNNSNVSLNENRSKDTKKKSDQIIFYEYLQQNVSTCSMVAEASGIKQKCLTWYKSNLEESNLLWVVKKDRCLITGRAGVQYLTTDPLKAPKDAIIQLNLFV